MTNFVLYWHQSLWFANDNTQISWSRCWQSKSVGLGSHSMWTRDHFLPSWTVSRQALCSHRMEYPKHHSTIINSSLEPLWYFKSIFPLKFISNFAIGGVHSLMNKVSVRSQKGNDRVSSFINKYNVCVITCFTHGAGLHSAIDCTSNYSSRSCEFESPPSHRAFVGTDYYIFSTATQLAKRTLWIC